MALSGVGAVHCGHTLALPERVAVRLSIQKLSLSESLASGSLQFWGKIFGGSADYVLLSCTTLGLTVRRQFYSSNDGGITFAKLPKPDAFVAAVAPKINAAFTGNPSHKYRDPDAKRKKAAQQQLSGSAGQQNEDEQDNEEQEEEEEEEEEEQEEEDEEEEEEHPAAGADDESIAKSRKQKARRLSELERLSWTVESIDFCCCVVPNGFALMSATGDIRLNSSFAGLSIDDAKRIESYSLLRDAKLPNTLTAIRKAGIANHTQFLDPLFASGTASISNSSAGNSNSAVDGSISVGGKHSWTLQVLDGGAAVQLRSLLWPGYEFRNSPADSRQFGGAYFGSGQRNDDLLFML